MKSFLTVFLIFALIGAVINVNKAQAQPAELDKFFDVLEKHNKVLLSVAVSKGEDLVYQRQIGLANVERSIPISRNTQFRVGSITKIFTAVLILQLVEEGKLTLNTKLAEFYPQIPNAENITIEQLLNHRTGIFNYTNDSAFMSYMTQTKSHEEMLEIITSYDPVFKPGAQFEYSNSNYVLLGYIAEKVSGKTYAELVDAKIVKKLKLTHTKYGDKIDTEQEAYSYVWQGKWNKFAEADMTVPAGAGAMVSTASEINQFMIGLVNGKLLSEESFAQMTALKDNYGFGIMSFPFYEHRAIGHNGGIDAFVSSTGYFEDADLTMTVLTSGVNFPFNDILIAILSEHFGKTVTIPNFTNVEMALTEEQLAKFVGLYKSEHFPLDIETRILQGKLFAQATGQGSFPLTPVSKTEFKFDPAGISISYDDTGSTMTLLQGGNKSIFERQDQE